VYITGGTGAVAPAVEAAVDALPGVGVKRWAGADRYLTGAVVVRNAMTTWAIPMVDIGLASGENFPDALAGGAVMGYKHGLLLLTRPSMLSAPTASLITANKATIESAEFFGGTGALAPAIPTTVRQLLQ
jgi:putative cell wall-binding protein